ncbi:MAG: RNA methyltransferase [Candidatus Brocadiaceae bacterium]|jgi:TrmH family RNA methyltransferase
MRSDDEVISRIKHPAVAEARRSVGEFRREEATCYLLDGHRLVRRALEARAPIVRLFLLEPIERQRERELYARANELGIPCHRVSRGVFFKILGLGYETSVRVLAVVKRPPSADAAALLEPGTCLLAGESIQDPRNVGVLVRTADAWDLPGAVFTADSADPWCRAAVRSSTGSIFHVAVTLAANLDGYLGSLKGSGARIIGTSAHAETACWEADLAGTCVIVLGNETVGISDEVRAACDQVVTVPMHGRADSLNITVAAGVLLYERARQRRLSSAP